MSLLTKSKALWKTLFRRSQQEEALRGELDAYLEMVVKEKVEQGVHPAQARRQARIEFGGVEQVKERVREVRMGRWVEEVWQDLKYGLRMLVKNPGFALVAILTLALGIGANTAIFSIIDTVLLRSLPVEQPEQLVLFSQGRRWGFIGYSNYGLFDIFSYPLYQHFRANNPAFEDVAAFRTDLDWLSIRSLDVTGNASPQLGRGKLVSGNYFSLLGVQPARGRVLTFNDDRPGASPVAVISYAYWQRQFRLDPSVVGRSFDINGIPVTVVGVTPPEFFGESVERRLADVWLPLSLQPALMKDRGSLLNAADVHWLNAIGRLRPGVSLQRAQRVVNTLLRQFLMEQAGASIPPDRRQAIQHAYVALVAGGRGVSRLRFLYSRPLHILLAVVGLVLLIACANVANVLLARAAARGKEISMRLAVGASRMRLVRQLLTESMLLALLGGLAGVLFASWGVRALVALVVGSSVRLPLNLSPDARVFAFTLGVMVLTLILFGLAPALKTTKVDMTQSLRSDTSAGSPGTRSRLTKLLVLSQVALSLLLLVGAGLFIRTLQNLKGQKFGFDQAHVLEIGINPRIAGYQQGQLQTLYRELLDRVNTVPGVQAASLSLYSPMSGQNWAGLISVEGFTPPERQSAGAQWVWVGPGYVKTEGMALLLGRDLTPRDDEGAPKVAVVNQAFVRWYLAVQNPIGRKFSLGVPAKKYDIEIVGVVKDFKFNNPRQDDWPVAFFPLAQAQGPRSYAGYLEVRTAGNPASVAGAVRQAVQEVDKNLPITVIRTLRDQIDEALGTERLMTMLSSFFGILALVLACVGLYGMLSFTVARRINKIGIRIALGAQRGNVLWLVMGQAMKLTLLGMAIGTAAALALTRLMASLLYGVSATDPLTLVGGAVLLAGVALLACYIPARRAMRVDPMVALRYE